MNGKRVLVCGGRDYHDQYHVWKTLYEFNANRGPIACVIHGAAHGADTQAWLWAKRMSRFVPMECLAFPANWRKWAKAAGPIRNQQMLAEGKPDYVIAFPGGPGTADMCRRAELAGIPVFKITARLNRRTDSDIP